MEAFRSTRERVHLRFAFAYTFPAHYIAKYTKGQERFMTQSAQHHTIHYVEFTTPDIAGAKAFYGKVFGWKFQDWGPDYISFDREHAGIDGGFRKGAPPEKVSNAAPLIVLYSKDLIATEQAVVAAGGSIVVPTFEFPGGRRFHFSDGHGNVLAVWSE